MNKYRVIRREGGENKEVEIEADSYDIMYNPKRVNFCINKDNGKKGWSRSEWTETVATFKWPVIVIKK